MQAAFQKMGDALRASGRDMIYAISQKGQFGVEQWASKTGANVWRTGSELDENWASVAASGFGQNGKESAAKPGAWNDPGLLQIGNVAMTADQSRMQLNLWAVLAAPLMLGNDVRIMTRETVALLGNRELIAVNQDKMGRQGKRDRAVRRHAGVGKAARGRFGRGRVLQHRRAHHIGCRDVGAIGHRRSACRARSVVARECRHRRQQIRRRPDRRDVDAAEAVALARPVQGSGSAR